MSAADVPPRSALLFAAEAMITGAREAAHGEASETFARVAGLWSAYLARRVTAADVAALNALQKLARARANPEVADHWTDVAGYAALGFELAVPGVLVEDDR